MDAGRGGEGGTCGCIAAWRALLLGGVGSPGGGRAARRVLLRQELFLRQGLQTHDSISVPVSHHSKRFSLRHTVPGNDQWNTYVEQDDKTLGAT